MSVDKDEHWVLPDGTTIKFGCDQPDVLRYAAVPAWDEANPVLSEAECEDTERLRPFLSEPHAQPYSNCTNASLAPMMEAMLRAAGVPGVEPLSRTFLWGMFNGGNPNNGAFCRDLADQLRKTGLPRLSLWPEEHTSTPRNPPAEVLADAGKHLALEVYQCMDWSHVRSALARDFFVYHGFVLGGVFIQYTPSNGKVPEWDGTLRNGHAMFSFGLTRRFGDLRACTRNSWGRTFGDKGTGYVPASYFWGQRGNFVNLDAFAFRAVVRKDPLPKAA